MTQEFYLPDTGQTAPIHATAHAPPAALTDPYSKSQDIHIIYGSILFNEALTQDWLGYSEY
jgi:hypothetical protein